jgi:hypothetical protein
MQILIQMIIFRSDDFTGFFKNRFSISDNYKQLVPKNQILWHFGWLRVRMKTLYLKIIIMLRDCSKGAT